MTLNTPPVINTTIAVDGRDVPAVSTRDIAEAFGKNHKDVLRRIQNMPDDDFSRRNFAPGSYPDENRQERPEYLVTESGFQLLAMGFTGEKARAWKIKYIQAFEAARSALQAIPAGITAEINAIRDQVATLTQRITGTTTPVLPPPEGKTGGSVPLKTVALLFGRPKEDIVGALIELGVCEKNPESDYATASDNPAIPGIVENAEFTTKHGELIQYIRVTGRGIIHLAQHKGWLQ